MMRVFFAIQVDTFRYLRSRFLFWIVLAFSAIAAYALFGTYSFTPEGIQFFNFTVIENDQLAQGTAGPRLFIMGLFNSFFVKFWLGWGAMILALVSTASIMPDFMRDGAIDLSLSRPVRRPWLFLYKYTGVLLFVFIQLLIGVGLAYLLIGLRFDIWLHKAMYAVPLLLLQFVYLSCIATFIAILTRSTLASLLGTVTIWFVLFLIQFSSNQLVEIESSAASMVETQTAQIERSQQVLDQAENPSERVRRRMESIIEQRDSSQRIVDGIGPWVRRLETIELIIPKTGDLQKILARTAEAPVGGQLMELMGADRTEMRPEGVSEEDWDTQIAAGDAGAKAVLDFSATKSILSSLAGSFLLLGIAAWRFSRRDF